MNGINMELIADKKISAYHVLPFLLALLFCTWLRISLLAIYPFFVPFLFYAYGWKLDRNAIYLFVFLILIWLFSFRHGFFLKYHLVSLYYFVPFLLLLLAVPSRLSDTRDHLKLLMYSLTVVMIVNNILGVFQYINHPYDDSFEGLYGTFTVSQNGLSVINAILFFYHLTIYQHRSRAFHLYLAIFFILCSIMGFYGAGLIAFFGAIILTYLRIRLMNIVRLLLLLVVLLGVLYLVMMLVSPLAVDYNVNIIKMFLDPSAGHTPRKLIIFKNYYTAYTGNITDLLFGSGPGTFNSRSAFMVGSPTYFNIEFIKSEVQPEYFKNYAYTLWNPSNTGPFDGFMNQPFTSLLAILGEYGLLLALAIVYVGAGRFQKVAKAGKLYAKQLGVSAAFKMYRFSAIFALLLLIIDNYMEYPEIIALLLIITKLSHHQLRRVFYT